MYERVMVRNNVLRCLWKFGIINTGKGKFRTIITESRTPATTKITFAAETEYIDILYDMRR